MELHEIRRETVVWRYLALCRIKSVLCTDVLNFRCSLNMEIFLLTDWAIVSIQSFLLHGLFNQLSGFVNDRLVPVTIPSTLLRRVNPLCAIITI